MVSPATIGLAGWSWIGIPAGTPRLHLPLPPLCSQNPSSSRRCRRLLHPACRTASVHFPGVVAVVLACTRQEERPRPLLSSSPHHEPGQEGPPWPGRSGGASRSPRSRPQGRPWRNRAEQVRRETRVPLSRCLLRRRRGSDGLWRLLSVSFLAPTRGSTSRWPWGWPAAAPPSLPLPVPAPPTGP